MNCSALWHPIQHSIYSLVPCPLLHVLLMMLMERELLPPWTVDSAMKYVIVFGKLNMISTFKQEAKWYHGFSPFPCSGLFLWRHTVQREAHKPAHVEASSQSSKQLQPTSSQNVMWGEKQFFSVVATWILVSKPHQHVIPTFTVQRRGSFLMVIM